MNLQAAYQCLYLATNQQHILMCVGICHKDGNSEWLIQSSGSDSYNREDNSSPRVYSIVTGAEPGMQLCPRQTGDALFLTSPSTNLTPWKYNWIAWKPHTAQKQCTGLLKQRGALISEWHHFPYILHISNCTFFQHHRQQTYCTGVNTACLRYSTVRKKDKHIGNRKTWKKKPNWQTTFKNYIPNLKNGNVHVYDSFQDWSLSNNQWGWWVWELLKLFRNIHRNNGMLCLIPIPFIIQKTSWHLVLFGMWILVTGQSLARLFFMLAFPEGILHRSKFSHLAPEIIIALFFAGFFYILMIGDGKYRIINKEKIRYSMEHSRWHLPIHFPNS